MSYFAFRPEPSPRHHVVPGARPIPVLPEHPHADQIKEAKIAAMQAGAVDFASRLDPTSAPRREGKAMGDGASRGARDSNIFGGPVQNPVPKLRIRTGVTDDELRKIWVEDEKKDRAAKAMMEQTDLVGKMVKDAYPLPRQKEAPFPRKAPGALLKPEENTAEPMGFKGMGGHCMPQKRQGVTCKPAEEFIPEELRRKEHKQGRRTQFPPNTFSFQDTIQTHGATPRGVAA